MLIMTIEYLQLIIYLSLRSLSLSIFLSIYLNNGTNKNVANGKTWLLSIYNEILNFAAFKLDMFLWYNKKNRVDYIMKLAIFCNFPSAKNGFP